MTAKKTTIKKIQVVKSKQATKEKPIYKPVFLPITIKRVIKTDANYYGIKQKLKNYAGLDLFRKLRDDKPKKEEKLKKENFLSVYWLKYCKWWNEVINHE